jgi:hypothetical protein
MAVATLAACLAAAGVLVEGTGAAQAGAVSASRQLTVQVWLTPDLAGAASFATAAATPGTARFRHYLSPDGYTEKFGPSAARAAAVTAWLSGAGLTQVRVDSGRDYVSATGTATRLQSAFDRGVSVPAALAADVLAVTGLDSDSPVTPAAQAASTSAAAAKTPTCSTYWGQHVQSLARPTGG